MIIYSIQEEDIEGSIELLPTENIPTITVYPEKEKVTLKNPLKKSNFLAHKTIVILTLNKF